MRMLHYPLTVAFTEVKKKNPRGADAPRGSRDRAQLSCFCSSFEVTWFWCGMVIEPSSLTVDRKSTRLNSSHVAISYAVFCLKKKKLPSYQKKFEHEKPENGRKSQ